MTSQRDTFLSELLIEAKKDDKIMLLSIDMGAPSLDKWKEELPKQFLPMGISEQNSINFAAGLASRGYKVYIYTMSCWAARCFEQLRYSCAMANNPITFLGCGVGLGYTPSGPGHNPTEDIAYMRSLLGIEIFSPANCNVVKDLVQLTLRQPKFRYIRLERSYPNSLDELYTCMLPDYLDWGMCFVNTNGRCSETCIIASGYMLDRALKVQNLLRERKNILIDVVDLWRIKPIDPVRFRDSFYYHSDLVTLEEQTLSGGFGSAICEMVCDLGMTLRVLRLGLPERYIFENGTREELLDSNGLSVEEIYSKILESSL